jgi:hypothetical protein
VSRFSRDIGPPSEAVERLISRPLIYTESYRDRVRMMNEWAAEVERKRGHDCDDVACGIVRSDT